ncbi:response regulator transcription factor [Nitrospira moscoviensis]|uniref:Transcriptional regulator, LuxR family n=1 Tax=Nitrospira moscoviensis TaxID=42253 RepID=A0A0K2G7L7_NITMO|nr:response regulator transcription factor [Nitrospira moscoviensis]ALA56943.1 Transcriptional regulator, LuxR family [Nitrospira moscoviensis]
MRKIRKCLVADDHLIVREGIRHLLLQKGLFTAVAEADHAAAVLAAVRREPWHLLMLDMALPGTHGVDVLKEVKRLRPPLPVLMVSLYPERELAREAFQAGASGYLTKDRAPAELLVAVRQVLAGRRYVGAALADQMTMVATVGRSGAVHRRLSERELKVLRLLARGRTVSRIADDMALSVKTVNACRTRLLGKLNLRTRGELVRYATDHRLLA